MPEGRELWDLSSWMDELARDLSSLNRSATTTDISLVILSRNPTRAGALWSLRRRSREVAVSRSVYRTSVQVGSPGRDD